METFYFCLFSYVCTGFGAHLALPLMREEVTPDMYTLYFTFLHATFSFLYLFYRTEEQAKALMTKCLQVLFYRDCRASCNVLLFTYFHRTHNPFPIFVQGYLRDSNEGRHQNRRTRRHQAQLVPQDVEQDDLRQGPCRRLLVKYIAI